MLNKEYQNAYLISQKSTYVLVYFRTLTNTLNTSIYTKKSKLLFFIFFPFFCMEPKLKFVPYTMDFDCPCLHIECWGNWYFVSIFVLTQMKTGKCLFMRYLLTAIWRLYFHPAKFDNFKVETMSDYKTVSVARSKNLLDWKPASLINYGRLFFIFFGAIFQNSFKKYCSAHTTNSSPH